MAEAPTPQGNSGEPTDAPDVAGGEPEVKTFTQQQVESIVAARLRNSKKESAALKAKLDELERKIAGGADDPDDEPAAPATAPAAQAAQADPELARLKRRFEKLERDAAEREKALTEKLASREKEHSSTLIAHALIDHLSGRGNIASPGEVIDLTSKHFEIADGKVVPTSEEFTSIEDFYDKWLATRKHHIVGPQSPGVDKPGGLPGGKGRKPLAEMGEMEAHYAGAKALLGKIPR